MIHWLPTTLAMLHCLRLCYTASIMLTSLPATLQCWLHYLCYLQFLGRVRTPVQGTLFWLGIEPATLSLAHKRETETEMLIIYILYIIPVKVHIEIYV